MASADLFSDRIRFAEVVGVYLVMSSNALVISEQGLDPPSDSEDNSLVLRVFKVKADVQLAEAALAAAEARLAAAGAAITNLRAEAWAAGVLTSEHSNDAPPQPCTKAPPGRTTVAHNVSDFLLLPELTTVQVATVMQAPLKTVIALCAQGRIPGAKKLGRLWRVNTKLFLKWRESEGAEVCHEHAGSEAWVLEGGDLASGETSDHQLPRVSRRRQDLRGKKKDRDSVAGHHRSENVTELRRLLR